MMKVLILFAVITTIFAKYDRNKNFAWWDTDDNKEYGSKGSFKRTPFPQCLLQGSSSQYLGQSSMQSMFDKTINYEEQKYNNEHYENTNKNNYDVMDYSANELRYDDVKSRTAAIAATGITKTIMNKLACDLSGANAANLTAFLSNFKVPGEFCSFLDKPDCTGKTEFRTITGVCNNIVQPYEGSSQTAFGRILPAAYDDFLSKPRRKSVRGGLLPACRKISLALGSKPTFDRTFNNLYVIFGQYLSHDIALSTPVSDTYLTPVSSCECSSKHDWNKCTVIDIQPDDPYLNGQKCMAFPATAQAFKDQLCSLGIKEQMNGNTHFPDLSGLYGSTLRTALALRGNNGLLKSTRKTWAKYEYPPAQREGKSCVDPTPKQPCLAGGDSRLMENLLFTGIQSMFLRLHNIIAKNLFTNDPIATSDQIFELTRVFTTDIFQAIVYGYWVPKLLGPDYGVRLLTTIAQTPYDPAVPPVVLNEVATAALRCHTLVRDLFSRCTPDGKRIDQLWLNDISHKAKFAYDVESNGIDSVLCGSLYDYGFAHDNNFAHQIHNGLFESKNDYGQYWRNDLVAINICRGREHGIQSYNAYRQHCNLTKAIQFRDFGDTINYEGIKTLESLYKSPDDVDLFVALTLEDALPGALVGSVSACLLYEQFTKLCIGDRFCITHKYNLTPAQLFKVGWVGLATLFCSTVDIEQIPLFPFQPPNDSYNTLVNCSKFILPPGAFNAALGANPTIDELTASAASIEKSFETLFINFPNDLGFEGRFPLPA